VLASVSIASLLNHTSGLANWTRDALRPQFSAGLRWQYSCEAYLLLQAILVKITGEEFASLIQTLVFTPLGMRDSSMMLTEANRARVVEGSGVSGAPISFPIREANAAASMHTSASDRTLLSLISASPVSVSSELGLSWGYGWGIEEARGGPYLWQWGNNPGIRAFTMLSSSSKSGFVLLTNSERGIPLAAPLARSIIPAEHGAFRFQQVS
jgi:CubicO group peptidase (beta-lactamase class C family)